jgi:hypothetical protein
MITRIWAKIAKSTQGVQQAKEDMERTLNDLYFEEKEVLVEKKKEDMRVQV